jgi:hypothetical protein
MSSDARGCRLWLVLLLVCSTVLLAPAAFGAAAAKAGRLVASARQRASITKVHLVQSNHLDVGFTGSITAVVNEYFDSYLLNAVNTSAALRQRGGEEQLVFTTHSYLLSLFLSCPRGRGLHCPTPAAVSIVEAALRDGSITVHAFPFNSELDMYDTSLIESGVKLSQELLQKYGRPAPTVLSQRDVPGVTQALVPVLSRMGVEAVSIGCNNAAQPPDVPPIFRWQAPATDGSGSGGGGAAPSLIGLVHAGGYAELNADGSCDDKTGNDGCKNHSGEYYTVEGCTEGLMMAWNSDNLGPPTLGDVIQIFNSTRKLFPNAKIVASTMDNFIRAVRPANKSCCVSNQ